MMTVFHKSRLQRCSTLSATLLVAAWVGGCSSSGDIDFRGAGGSGDGDAGGTNEVASVGGMSPGTMAGGTGGVGGGGGEAPSDPCEDGEWTCLRMGTKGPYGSHAIVVPAAQNWVNTGLFLTTGQTAQLTVEGGSWMVNNKEGQGIDHGSCLIGDLVARIGLHYKDQALTCVDGSATFTADKEGILFLGALPSNDLGESYETRRKATGEKTVRVESDGHTVPTVLATEAADYPFAEVSSGWVEIMGAHIIVTLPVATATVDADVLETALDTLDEFYELHEELRSGVPQHGQRIRFFPDGTNPGLMLAGNPVRMKTTLVTAEKRISRAGQPGVGVWGYAHELGHDFSFVDGNWTYQVKTLESWPNIFSVHAFEKMQLTLHKNTIDCDMNSTGNYDAWSAWVGLCFLRQFEFAYGWSFYKDFFVELNKQQGNQGIKNWNTVHDAFETVAGEDITPIFEAWSVPNPG